MVEKEIGRRSSLLIFALIATLLAGIAVGVFWLPLGSLDTVSEGVMYTLYLLLFLIGADMASSGNLWKRFRQLDRRLYFLPILSILGSVIAGAFTGQLFHIGAWQGAAIGGGMGWYSISGVLLGQTLGAQFGALAFLTNIFRELYSFILMPFLFRRGFGPSAITVGGATTMDTTLPIINRYGGSEMTLVAILHGLVCSAAVPIIVPFLASLVH